MHKNRVIAIFWWLLSVCLGCYVSLPIARSFITYEHWFYLFGVSYNRADVIASLMVGICLASRDLSQIYITKLTDKTTNILLQALLVVLIVTCTLTIADPMQIRAAAAAWVVSLTIDLIVFNTCKSNLGWRIIFSSLLASAADVGIYNILIDDVGIYTHQLINFTDYIFKTAPSVICACYIERYHLLYKIRSLRL